MRLKVAVILNSLSGKKKIFYSRLLPVLREHATVDVFETQSETDAFTFSAHAVAQHADVIIAAGGDGTIHQVVNGMLKSNLPADRLPALTILPIGSGNDLARTLNISLSVDELKSRLLNRTFKRIDVGSVRFRKEGREQLSYFVNVCSAGMGPEVLSRMHSGKKTFGATLAYYVAILKTFSSYRCILVTIKTPGWSWSDSLRSLAIGNGKYFGNGLCIAPEARVDDHELAVFIAGPISVFDFVRFTGRLKGGRKIDHPKIAYKTATALELTSKSICRIEADGELLGFLPAEIKVIPQRINFLY